MIPRCVPKNVFVGGPGHDVRALGKGLLEMGPCQAQDMGHVVHQDRAQADLIQRPP